ncbi:MAG TPA: histidine phosphatase family protein [Gaiellaceae bacterium]|nr:histidine phosphatase family protein [Gaiellaceae bacterium]
MTTLYLARHGESDWNAANRFQGHSDRPLTELGRRQAEALAEKLEAHAALTAIYSSPLARAFETASIVGARLGLQPTPVDDLREVDVGGWSGLRRSEVEARYPDAFRRWLDGGEGWEDGETYADMATRVLDALRRIAGTHPDEEVLVVSHGGPIRAIHAVAAGIDVHAYRRLNRVEGNADVSRVAVEGDRISRLD